MTDEMDLRGFFGQIRNRASPMELFKTAGTGRGTNDSNNKTRETILVGLYHSTDPALQELRTLWITFLRTLCSEPYDDVQIKQRGGRGANHDFDIVFLHGSLPVREIPAEFKHNASRIDKLPEYFSPAANKPYIPTLYADFFYDSAMDQLCAIYPSLVPHKPTKDAYVRLVHTNNYDCHPFFRALYTAESTGTAAQAKQKQVLVAQTIRDYLTMYSSHLRLDELSKDLQARQTGKVFILWTLKEFKSDTIRDDEMDLSHVEGIKNGNTLVVVSKAGTKHNMLLRWKNHLGVLYPAWQISLSR